MLGVTNLASVSHVSGTEPLSLVLCVQNDTIMNKILYRQTCGKINKMRLKWCVGFITLSRNMVLFI